MTNCGLSALSQITELKDISAFTLVHAARDNGFNLHVFKVNDLKDLVRVQRPCIFHQKEHFVFSKNGEPMPDGDYTGYVIGPAVLGRVIALSEAKFIKGGKNFFTGKNSDGEQTGHGAIGDILSAVVGAVTTLAAGPYVGAAAAGAVNATYKGVETAQNQDELGSPYNPLSIGKDLLVGAAEGYGAGSLASGVVGSGASATGGAAAKAAFQQAVSGGIGSGIGAGGAAGGITAAQVAGASGAGGLAGGLASQVSAFGGGTAAPGTAATGYNAATFTPGALNSSFSLSGVPFSPNSPVTPTLTKGAATTPATQTPSLLSKVGTGITNSITKSVTDNPIGTAASLAGGLGVFGSKAPAYNAPSPAENYSAVKTFLGSDPQTQANSTFGLAATNQNTDYVNTSIQDLQKQFTGNNQRTLDTINTAYDNQRQQLTHQFAQAGQNMANSSELQNKVGELEQKRTNDLTLAQQELTDQALGQAVQVKQQALSQGMQAGQWNQTLAFQLASLTGDQQNLQYAIANNDYTAFQQIMGKLMTMGIPQSTIGGSGSSVNINLGKT